MNSHVYKTVTLMVLLLSACASENSLPTVPPAPEPTTHNGHEWPSSWTSEAVNWIHAQLAE